MLFRIDAFLVRVSYIDDRYSNECELSLSNTAVCLPFILVVVMVIVVIVIVLISGERVSGKGADLYEMCDELDAILRGW